MESRPAIFAPVIAALEAASVRYVIVGGVAVVLQGYPRVTMDLDLVVELAPENALRAVNALVATGLRPVVPVEASSFADPAVRRSWVREKGMKVFSLRDPGFPIRQVDIFVEHPIDFDEMWRESVEASVDGTPVRVASIDHLIRMKQRAGRPKDLADIEALRTLLADTDDDG